MWAREEEILWLKVSMHNTKRMTGFHDLNNGPNQVTSFPLAIMAFLNDPVEELSPCTKLHDHKYIRRILICTLNGHDVALPRQMVQDLNLSPHVFHILGRDELPFRYGFASILCACGSLHAQVSRAELALTQLDLEVIEELEGLRGAEEDAGRARR